MTDKCFVDTNVLIYAHDAAADRRHQLARDLLTWLWEEGSAVISTQVLQEFCVNVLRKTAFPPSRETLANWISDYLQWEVVVNDGGAVLDALSLRERYQLSFWDAMIVQAAHSAGAVILYSEDLNHGQQYGQVRVQNPFL